METFSEQRKIFIGQLKELYWIEKQQLKIIPRLEKAATTRYLKASYKGHLVATQQHVCNLEQVFDLLNEKNVSKKNKTAEDIILKARSVIKTTQKKTLLRDLGLIMNTKAIEEYEIEIYSKLIKMAWQLKEIKAVSFLEENFLEEQEAEETFNAIKEDTLKDDFFITIDEMAEELEVAEEE